LDGLRLVLLADLVGRFAAVVLAAMMVSLRRVIRRDDTHARKVPIRASDGSKTPRYLVA